MSKALISNPEGRNILADPKRVKWVRERLTILKKIVDNAYLEFTELLYEAANGQYFKEWGFERFEEYVETELGWQERKGWYFVAIQKKLVIGAKVPKADLEEIGWTKASRLSSLPSEELEKPEKVKEWVERAKKTKARELKIEVNKAKNKAVGTERFSTEDVELVSFGFHPEQKKTVELALDIARKISGEKKKSFLFEMICLSFAAEKCEEMNVKLERILQTVERVYELELVAVKVKGANRDIIHGQKLMRQMLKEGVAE
jgi:hypothetical protein